MQVVALKMVRVLVAAGCSPFTAREPDDKTPATVAVDRGLSEITAYWLDQLGPLDLTEWTALDTQRLLTSAAENRVEELQRALEPPPRGRRLNCETADEQGDTVLLAAAARSASASLNYLLDRGCDINVRDAEGNTPLHHACLNVDVEEAHLLFTKSSELVHSLEMRVRAAAAAAETDALGKGLKEESVKRYVGNVVERIERAETVKWTQDFLLPGCPYQAMDVNVPNNQGDTPLHIAAHLGSRAMVEFLLRVGADASLQNHGELTALETARLAQRQGVFEPLREAQHKIQGLVMQAERRVRVKLAKESLQLMLRRRKENISADADVRAKISRQVDAARVELQSAKEAATLESCMEAQRVLYLQDVEFQKTSAFARQLLAAITSDNMRKLLKLLALTDDVTASASSVIPDLSPRDISRHAARVIFPQYTPPAPPSDDMVAAEQTSPARRRKREAEEADALPRRAMPILHVACAMGKASCAELLLRLGVPANWDIEGYNTPLHFVCHLGYVDICAMLIRCGASVEARNAQGRAVLHLAARSGNTVMVKTLLDCAADPYVVDHDGRTALHAAAEMARVDASRLLLMSNPALCSLLSVYYETPLHSLLISVAKGLVSKGAESTVIAAAELLLEFGVDDRQICFTEKGLKLKTLGLCRALSLTATAQAIVRLRRLLLPRRAGKRRRAPLDEQARLKKMLEASLARGSGDFESRTAHAALRIQTLARGYIVRKRTGPVLAGLKSKRLAAEAAYLYSITFAACCLQARCRGALLSKRWRKRSRFNPSSWFRRFGLTLPSFAQAIPRAKAALSSVAESVKRLIAAASCRSDHVRESGPQGSGDQGAAALETRADHVAVLEWYRDAVDQGAVGTMVLEELENDGIDADVEDEEAEERDVLAGLPHDPSLHSQVDTRSSPGTPTQEARAASGKGESPQKPATGASAVQSTGDNGAEEQEDQGSEAGTLVPRNEAARQGQGADGAISRPGAPRELSNEDLVAFRGWTLASDIDAMEDFLKYLTPAQRNQLTNLPLQEGMGQDAAAGRVLLHHVAEKGVTEIAVLLVKNGARVQEADAEGTTAVHCAVKGGFEKLVKTLYDRGASLNSRNVRGESPLHLAAGAGALECIKELFLCANSAGSVQGLATEEAVLGSGMTPFLAACAGAHVECAKLLMEQSQFAAHSFSDNLDTGAHLLLRRLAALKSAGDAAEGEQRMLSSEMLSTFFEMLVHAGCDLFSKDRDGLSPAALARQFRISAASEALEQLNTPVVQGDLETILIRCTCVHCLKRARLRRDAIVEQDDGAALKALLVKYAAAREILCTVVDLERNTLLHQLCATGKLACLRALLDSRYFDKSLVMLHNAHGESPLHVAIRANDKASLDALLVHIASVREVPLPHPTNSAWLASAVLDTVSPAETAKANPAAPAAAAGGSAGFEQADTRDDGLTEDSRGEFEGANCVHIAAAMRGGAELLDRLFKALEDGEAAKESARTDARGLTCLHIACLCLQIESIRIIVKRVGTRSPLIHALTSDGQQQTSVHLAVQARPTAPRSEAELAILPMIRELLLLGADATALDANLQTPETLAKKLSLPGVAEVLSNVESPASKLTRAVLACDDLAVRAQLEDMKVTGSLAATINGKGRDGKSALHHACAEGFLPGVAVLLEYEADVADTDISLGGHSLWWATRHGRGDVAAFLCRKGANPSARAKDGSSALHGACYKGLTAIVETLLGHRALDTSWTDAEGLTALDLACAQGHVSTVKSFVIARPDSVNDCNRASESPLFAAVRGTTSKAMEISELLVDEDVDPKRVNAQGKTVLEVAKEKDKPDAVMINWLSSLLNEGAGYLPEDEEETGAIQRVRRPRISGRVNGDARFEPARLAAARYTSEMQADEAQTQRDALQLQRQEALARKEADKTRASARAALLARSSAMHPASSGYRAGRLTAEVINAKVPNRANADGHVIQVWKDDDFFRCELEVEHLLGSTAAAVSAEPVWREKLVMPVLESSACVAVRLLLRTFRGANVEWQVVGSHEIPVASLVMPAVSTGEDEEWMQVFAKRWPSKPDLVPTANLRIKLSYVEHVPDQLQVAAEPDLNSFQTFAMPQPLPSNLAAHIKPPPGPDAGGPAAPRVVGRATQIGVDGGQGLHLHAEQDFVEAGAWLEGAGYQHDAVKDLMSSLREAKSLFLSAMHTQECAHTSQKGNAEGGDTSSLLPTHHLRKHLSMMGYLDDEIHDVLEHLDPEDKGLITLERFLLKGSLLLDGYHDSDKADEDVRSDMIADLDSWHADKTGASRVASGAEGVEAPHSAGTDVFCVPPEPEEAWGKLYVAVVSAADLAVSGPCSLAVGISLVVDAPGQKAGRADETINVPSATIPRADARGPLGCSMDGHAAPELMTGYVGEAGPVNGMYEWNEDMVFVLQSDPQKFADGLLQETQRRERVGLAVKVHERLADGTRRLMGHTRVELTEGEICRALEEARHYDKPLRLSSVQDNFYGRSAEEGMPSKDLIQAEDYKGTLRLVISCAPSRQGMGRMWTPLLCPMQCGAAYLQPFLPLHSALVCSLALVPCPNKHVGCQEMMQRQHVPQHLAHACGFRGASAGLFELQRQVSNLHEQAASIAAAMNALPSQLEQEQEARAEHQLLQMPPEFVAQARAGLGGKEWARLSWQRKFAHCQSFLPSPGTLLVERPQKSSSPPTLNVAMPLMSSPEHSFQETGGGGDVRGETDAGDVHHDDVKPKALVCCATLKHAGGETLAVCAVHETHHRTVLLASASEPDKAVRLWQLSENGQNAEHLHSCAPRPSPVVALYSSPLIGGKVFSGGSFPADVIEIYNTDSVRDSVLRSAGSGSHPPLTPSARLGQPGNQIEVNAMLAVDSWKLLSGDDSGVVSKWDIETGTQELKLKEHSLGVRSLARLDENTFVSGSIDTSILVWDMRAQRDSAGVLQGQCDAVTQMRVLQGAEFLLVSAGPCTMKVWDMRMMRLMRDLDSSGPLALLADKTMVTSFPDAPYSFRSWDVPTFTKTGDVQAHLGPIKALDSFGACVYSIAADACIKIWHRC